MDALTIIPTTFGFSARCIVIQRTMVTKMLNLPIALLSGSILSVSKTHGGMKVTFHYRLRAIFLCFILLTTQGKIIVAGWAEADFRYY